MQNTYNIKKDEMGKDLFTCTIQWTDESGIKQTFTTDEVDAAEATIGLLSGNICLSDLEP